MSAKLATLGLLKVKVFWSKVYNIIISVHDVTDKLLSRQSNYIVVVVMWQKCDNVRVWPQKPFIFSCVLDSSLMIWNC